MKTILLALCVVFLSCSTVCANEDDSKSVQIIEAARKELKFLERKKVAIANELARLENFLSGGQRDYAAVARIRLINLLQLDQELDIPSERTVDLSREYLAEVAVESLRELMQHEADRFHVMTREGHDDLAARAKNRNAELFELAKKIEGMTKQ